MKEKIIQGGIVNGVKMLVCPTWEEDFQTEIHKTGGCLRISMNYSAVDVSYWKELEEIAERYGYDLDEWRDRNWVRDFLPGTCKKSRDITASGKRICCVKSA